MAVNGDPANHSSASNKSIKKMKKRKELDALLTGSNGKSKHFNKPTKVPKKDGHELLIPDESDSLDSSENDFFTAPKKTVIRKPRPWRICATCIPLCIFVLTLACIVVTTGLIWMHMDLKQDLDDLRERLAKVESDVQTSQTQAATVITLENKLEKLQGLIITNQQALAQMKPLNNTINELKTQVNKVVKNSQSNTAASNELQLQQEVANMGARVTEVEEMKGTVKSLQDRMGEVTGNIQNLQVSVHQLQIAQHTTAIPTAAIPRTGSRENYPQDAANTIFLRQELDRFGTSVDSMNSTLTEIRQNQQGLDARLTLLEAMGGVPAGLDVHKDNTVSITPQMMTVFTKIHNDVNTLMNWYNETQLHTPTEVSTPTVETPVVHLPEFVSTESHTQWEQYVNSSLTELQNKLQEIVSNSSNTSNPVINVTAEIQKSLDELTNTYKHDLDTTRGDVNTLMNNLNNVQDRFTLVYQRLDELQRIINNGRLTTIHIPDVNPTTSPSPIFPPHMSTNLPSTPTEPPAAPKTSPETMHDRMTTTPGMWETTNPSLREEVTTIADMETTGVGLEGPEWQKPLDIFHPTRPPTVTFPSIKNIRDLANKFSLWDRDGDGYVLYSDLPDFMGPFTPSEESLMKFDADKDGRFSLQELIAAAGLV